jgi:hypothetical protein
VASCEVLFVGMNGPPDDLLLMIDRDPNSSYTLLIRQGQYRYPDGSVYTGGWVAGLKDGPGVYWDTIKVGGKTEVVMIIQPCQSSSSPRRRDIPLAPHPSLPTLCSQGCLRGSWVKGILKGEGTYDQPAVRFTGNFVRGVPSGECRYTLVSHRTLDMDRCGPG